jgi:hypothetical protein
MFRVVLLVLLALHVNAGELFKESRYIYAIDKTLFYEGEITFLNTSIEIAYTKPKKEKVIYLEDDENLQKRNYYLILKAIYSDDTTSLKEFFEMKYVGVKTQLLPKGILSEYMKKVEFKKQDKSLEYLKIEMQNEDWIEIETIH